MRLLEKYIFEILRKPSVMQKEDNIGFVRDAYYKEGLMKRFQDIDWDEDKFVSYSGVDFVIRESRDSGDDLIAVFMLDGEEPAGYVALYYWMGGVKIGTIAVGIQYRSGATKKIYGCIVNEFGLLYSDNNQTPEARGVWNSLFKSGKFDMYAVEYPGMKRYEVKSMERDGDRSSKELGLVDDELSLYGDEGDEDSMRFLLCIEKKS